MSGSLDAGRYALAGFIYQLTGSMHDALKLQPRPRMRDGACDAVFALEKYGQDATTLDEHDSGKSIVLIQYKYSSDSAAYPIDASELIEILQAFRKSKNAARGDGYENVRFRLVTNRELNGAAKTMASKAAKGEPYEPLDNPNEQKVGDKVVNAGRGKRINKVLRRILRELIIGKVDESQLLHGIEQCAMEFGLIGDELPGAITRLFRFAIDKATSADNRFTRDQILERVTNYPEPRSLHDEAIRGLIERDLETFRQRARMEVQIIRRPIMDQILTSLDHALIVVVGGGGDGKTVTLAEFIRELLGSRAAAAKYVLIDSAYRLDDAWLGRTVSAWRNSNIQAHRNEPIDQALARLEAPGVETQPVLVLGLDAIDEVSELSTAYHAMQRLIEFFLDEERQCRVDGRPARATLIMTCRDNQELERIGVLDRSGFGTLDDPTKVISIGDFSDDELIRVADTLENDGVADRLRQHVAGGSSPPYSRSAASMLAQKVDADSFDTDVDSAAYAAIKHPVIWRFFAALDEVQQHLVLNGEVNGLNELADRLLQWFCRKTEIRSSHLREFETRAVLAAAAGRFDDPSRVGDKDADWVAPAVTEAGCARVAAESWFREVISSGLVEKLSAQGWRWRHAFVCEFLRASEYKPSAE